MKNNLSNLFTNCYGQFLNVKPHYKVLDYCVAPRSKTAQIIKILHSDGGDKRPVGFFYPIFTAEDRVDMSNNIEQFK